MMAATTTRLESRVRQRFRSRVAALVVICFSLLYFADTILRASGKYFWFDELCTYYVNRLPDLHSVWQAILHAADYNPPLFHILTRVANAPFGDGLIATRMPAMIGFWVLCLSLFAMVRKRSGTTAGVVAMLLPLLSQARFYAYEARPYGIVVGLAGLAALAWQRMRESDHRALWRLVFGLSLWTAFLVHCYAILLLVPFGLAELYWAWHCRRPDWLALFTMGSGALIAMFFYVPMLQSFEKHLGSGYFAPALTSFPKFYDDLLGPAILGLIALLSALALERLWPRRNLEKYLPGPPVPYSEIVLAVGFLVLPLAGLGLAFVMRGPFIPRYFLSAILGISLLAGYAAGAMREPPWLRGSLAAVLALLAVLNFTQVVRQRLRGMGEMLVGFGSDYPVSTTPGNPMGAHQILLSQAPDGVPIMVLDPLEYLFLAHYAPTALSSRLYFVSADGNDWVGEMLKGIRDWCHAPLNLAYDRDFRAGHPRFCLYGQYASGSVRLALLMKEGVSMQMLATDTVHFLGENVALTDAVPAVSR
jgi:Dolichyl-phosphate-mannose-protein mannosyltransferase